MANFDRLQFLPIGPRFRPAKPHKTHGDRYADPNVQLASRLGQYGFDLLQLVINKYPTYIADWQTAFAKILQAYAIALGARDKTFEDARLEREADAAFDAFILSLLTGGAMVFLGAWVQYSLVPSVTSCTYKWNWSGTNLESTF
jgi:hypothetical protein